MESLQHRFKMRKIFFSVKFRSLVFLPFYLIVLVFGVDQDQRTLFFGSMGAACIFQLINSRRVLLEISEKGFSFNTNKSFFLSDLKNIPIADIGSIHYVRSKRPWVRLFWHDRVVVRDHQEALIQEFTASDWAESQDGWTLSEAIMRCPSLTALLDQREWTNPLKQPNNLKEDLGYEAGWLAYGVLFLMVVIVFLPILDTYETLAFGRYWVIVALVFGLVGLLLSYVLKQKNKRPVFGALLVSMTLILGTAVSLMIFPILSTGSHTERTLLTLTRANAQSEYWYLSEDQYVVCPRTLRPVSSVQVGWLHYNPRLESVRIDRKAICTESSMIP